MDISSVKTPPVQPPQRPKSAEVTQQAKSSTVKHQEPEVKKAPEPKPTPVINTQGQTTGRLLNVTA